ncbi:MAG TPA: tRNA pseudouridine(13) synthase TruD [Nanoarchaeota archaeon]|nr:tRNA pseudouridine(13) synthase TruD [Nanoarchaeota archaeon]
MKLKQIPEDFFVREIMDIKLQGKGEYAVFVMQKKRYTTINAVQRIAKELEKNPKAFNTSGMKDKDAITEQYVSGFGIKKEELQKLKLKDIKVFFKGYSDEPIKLASHAANYFEITARALDKELKPIEHFCNYYDEQRFGGIRPNMAKVGELIVKIKWEDAMKAYLLYPFSTETEEHHLFRKQMEKSWGRLKLGMAPSYLAESAVVDYLAGNQSDFTGAFRQLPKQVFTLFIHAYQSKLFNEMLAEYVREHCKISKEIEYCFGKLPMADETIELKIPLAGYDFNIDDVDERIKPLVKAAINEIDVKQFSFDEIPFLSSRTVFRDASAGIAGLKTGEPEKDELNNGKLKQKVCFTLAKGSFGTIAVKAMA